MGFFSWITQDTNKSISNVYSNQPTFTVYMGDHNGNYWVEDNYEGYGEFGGKDYYQLLAEMNMIDPKYHTRDVGIDLEFDTLNVLGERKFTNLIYPSLTEFKPLKIDSFKDKQPLSCPAQGYFYDLFDEEDYEDY